MAGPSIVLIHDTATGEDRTLTTEDLAGASGSAADPSIVQGTDGATAERLATFGEQESQTAALEAIQDATEAVGPRASTIGDSNVSATTVAAPLSAAPCVRVLIVASKDNTARVRVGGPSVSTTVGIPLDPRGAYEALVSNANQINVCAETGTQVLHVQVIP